MSDNQIHSTGRGGAGNIGQDPNAVYVDGEVVREGVVGQPGHLGGGDYSAGRGGAGNVVPSPRGTPKPTGTAHPPPATGGSTDEIPETAMREQHPGYENFHTGRGGGGNVHKDKYGGHTSKREQEGADPSTQEAEKAKGGGFIEKAKHAIGLDKK